MHYIGLNKHPAQLQLKSTKVVASSITSNVADLKLLKLPEAKDEDFIFINDTSGSTSSTPKSVTKKACLTSYFLAVKHMPE